MNNNKIIQLTAGRGPVECSLVVAKVLKIFIKELVESNIEYAILNKTNGDSNGSIRSVTISITGKGLTDFVQTWLGTIKWIGKSPIRKFHKRKNWFISCQEIEKGNRFTFNEREVSFQAIRSSGPGGQHVNKVSSAIRATHNPTKVQVLVMDSRSQHQNKRIAIERLKEKVMEFQLNQIQNEIQQTWENHTSLERGNAIRVFEGKDFKRNYVSKKYNSQRQKIDKEWKRKLE